LRLTRLLNSQPKTVKPRLRDHFKYWPSEALTDFLTVETCIPSYQHFDNVRAFSTRLCSVFFYNVIASNAYIHPVYGVRVWTHDLLVMSRPPQPLDHGFSPTKNKSLFLRPKGLSKLKTVENMGLCKESLGLCRFKACRDFGQLCSNIFVSFRFLSW